MHAETINIVFKILRCYKVSFYYYVNWVYLIAREQWHIGNSFTFAHICQPFNIYYVLITKKIISLQQRSCVEIKKCSDRGMGRETRSYDGQTDRPTDRTKDRPTDRQTRKILVFTILLSSILMKLFRGSIPELWVFPAFLRQ